MAGYTAAFSFAYNFGDSSASAETKQSTTVNSLQVRTSPNSGMHSSGAGPQPSVRATLMPATQSLPSLWHVSPRCAFAQLKVDPKVNSCVLMTTHMTTVQANATQNAYVAVSGFIGTKQDAPT